MWQCKIGAVWGWVYRAFVSAWVWSLLTTKPDAPFLSSDCKHRQHYQRPQLAPALCQVSTKLMPASIMSQRSPYLPRPLGFLANLQSQGKALIWRQASRVPRWAGEKSDLPPPALISPTHTHTCMPTAPLDVGANAVDSLLDYPVLSLCVVSQFVDLLRVCVYSLERVISPQKDRSTWYGAYIQGSLQVTSF